MIAIRSHGRRPALLLGAFLTLLGTEAHAQLPAHNPPEVRAALDSVADGFFVRPYRFSEAPPQPKVLVADRGNLFVFHDDTGEFIPPGFRFAQARTVDRLLREIFTRFYSAHPDEFEFLVLLAGFNLPDFFAAYLPFANDVKGLGYRHRFRDELFDNTPDSKLEGVLIMNNFRNYLGGLGQALGHFIFAQELGHRWGAFARYELDGRLQTDHLGRSEDHWSWFFNAGNSALEGNHWRDNGDGSFTSMGDLNAPLFGALDLYLMGLGPPEDVQDLFVINDARIPDDLRNLTGGPITPASQPEILRSVTIEGRRDDVTIEMFQDAEGEREPTHLESPKTFRTAFILLQRESDDFTEADFAQVDGVRRFFEASWERDVLGRAELITNLRARTGQWYEACESLQQCDAEVADRCLDAEDPRYEAPLVCAKSCESDTDCQVGGPSARCCATTAQTQICQYDFLCPPAPPTPTPTPSPTPTPTPAGSKKSGGCAQHPGSPSALPLLALLCLRRQRRH